MSLPGRVEIQRLVLIEDRLGCQMPETTDSHARPSVYDCKLSVGETERGKQQSWSS